MQSPVLGKEEPFAAIRAGAAEMGSSSAERGVGSELDASWQSTLAAEKTNSLQDHG